MAAEKAIGSGMKTAGVIAGGLAGLGVAGVLLWMVALPPAAPPGSAPLAPAPAAALEPAPAPEAASAPETASPVEEAAPAGSGAPDPMARPGPAAVSVENWRVEADGAALVSGRAEPGARISILVDGAEVADTMASARGDYVALFSVPANDRPSLMTLAGRLEDGRALSAPDAIALAPVAGPALAEASPPVSVLVTEEGVEVIGGEVAPVLAASGQDSQPAQSTPVVIEPAPEPRVAPVASVVIAAIAYTPADEVQISGQGEPGRIVRLYLDNTPVVDVPVPPNGRWSVRVPGIAEGIYMLRADQLDEGGVVTARFETPFKRESTEALAALSGPAPEAIPQAIPEPASAPQSPVAPEPTPPDPAVPVVASDAPPDVSLPEVAPAAAAPKAVASSAPSATVTGAAEPPAEAAPGPVPQTVSITVQPGYSLWRIARDTYGEGVLYVQVFEANRDKIGDPDLIYPGQVFTLPAQ